MSNNFKDLEQINCHKLNKDLLRSICLHLLLVGGITIWHFFGKTQFFIEPAGELGISNPGVDKPAGLQSPTELGKQGSPVPLIKANLIDQKSLQEAIERQEQKVNQDLLREKKIVQQEQKLADLTRSIKEEALKVKKEAHQTKLERDKLQKEQQDLKAAANKLEQQNKELAKKQKELAKLQPPEQKKKPQITPDPGASSQAESSSGQVPQALPAEALVLSKDPQGNMLTSSAEASASDLQGSFKLGEKQLQNYYAEWRSEIIKNRKKLMFFPENMTCTIKIKVLADGQLSLVKIEKSSGNLAYDAFSEQAIYRSAPFIMPEDPALKKELTETEHVFHFDDSAFEHE